MNKCERRSAESFEEDYKRKRQLFDQAAKPCYAEMLRLSERHMNPTCILVADNGSSVMPRSVNEELRDSKVVIWKMDEKVEGLMSAYRIHIKELRYTIFGFEMEINYEEENN